MEESDNSENAGKLKETRPKRQHRMHWSTLDTHIINITWVSHSKEFLLHSLICLRFILWRKSDTHLIFSSCSPFQRLFVFLFAVVSSVFHATFVFLFHFGFFDVRFYAFVISIPFIRFGNEFVVGFFPSPFSCISQPNRDVIHSGNESHWYIWEHTESEIDAEYVRWLDFLSLSLCTSGENTNSHKLFLHHVDSKCHSTNRTKKKLYQFMRKKRRGKKKKTDPNSIVYSFL